MAYTTHPNQLDTKRGLRAGLIGLAVVLFAAVAALGYSVVSHDSETAPAAVDFPTVDEMRAENMEIRRQVAAAAAAVDGRHPLPDQRRDASREPDHPRPGRGRQRLPRRGGPRHHARLDYAESARRPDWPHTVRAPELR